VRGKREEEKEEKRGKKKGRKSSPANLHPSSISLLPPLGPGERCFVVCSLPPRLLVRVGQKGREKFMLGARRE